MVSHHTPLYQNVQLPQVVVVNTQQIIANSLKIVHDLKCRGLSHTYIITIVAKNETLYDKHIYIYIYIYMFDYIYWKNK
jgi:hypothetical protein